MRMGFKPLRGQHKQFPKQTAAPGGRAPAKIIISFIGVIICLRLRDNDKVIESNELAEAFDMSFAITSLCMMGSYDRIDIFDN